MELMPSVPWTQAFGTRLSCASFNWGCIGQMSYNKQPTNTIPASSPTIATNSQRHTADGTKTTPSFKSRMTRFVWREQQFVCSSRNKLKEQCHCSGSTCHNACKFTAAFFPTFALRSRISRRPLAFPLPLRRTSDDLPRACLNGVVSQPFSTHPISAHDSHVASL